MKHLAGEHLLSPNSGRVHEKGNRAQLQKISHQVGQQEQRAPRERPRVDDLWQATLFEFMSEGWLDDMYEHSPSRFDSFPDQHRSAVDERDKPFEKHDLYIVLIIIGLIILAAVLHFVVHSSSEVDLLRQFWQAYN